MHDPNKILLEVLTNFGDADKWRGQPFETIKRLSNTKVGDAGQAFVERLCSAAGLGFTLPSSRQSPWDICIAGTTFEVKTATEDVSGSFQFNHIHYHRDYDALLCIGISPDDIWTRAWTKAEVATGKAGTLVSMEKRGNASHKLTKRRADLLPIAEFSDTVTRVLDDLN